MHKNAKIIIAAVTVVVIAALLGIAGEVPVAAGVFVIGALGVGLLASRAADEDVLDDEAPVEKPKVDKTKAKANKATAKAESAQANKKSKKSKLDQAIEDSEANGNRSPFAAPTAPSASAGLPTWTPGAAPADAWAAPTADGEVLETDNQPFAWDAWDDSQHRAPVEELEDENPLSALDRLDEIDPIAEVERLEGLGAEAPAADSGFSFTGAPKVVIDESSVQTADDVMAASQATELHVASDENSELAKLLAKVQARLSAYE